jgi:hypothetical protein
MNTKDWLHIAAIELANANADDMSLETIEQLHRDRISGWVHAALTQHVHAGNIPPFDARLQRTVEHLVAVAMMVQMEEDELRRSEERRAAP